MGGAHRWKKFVEHLPESYDCRVVCPPPTFPFGSFDRSYRPWKREDIDGVSVTRLWTYQPTTRGTKYGRILNNVGFALVASLYVLLNFWRYDRVVTMAGPHTTFLPGVVAKLLRRVWIIDVFDLWLDNAVDLGYVERGSIPHRIVAKLEEIAFTRSDHAIVLTSTMADQFREKYDLEHHRLTPIPFGVDRDLFSPGVDGHVEDKIVYFGNLGEGQAFVPFLEGFADADDGLELHIAGSGDRRDELESLCEHLDIADRVRFHGLLPREEIPKLVASSVLSFVPVKTGDDYKLDYARPTKLLESMSAGTPFVASNVEEIERVADMSGAGFAVENEPCAVADSIYKIRENWQTRNLMSKRAVDFIEEHHDWNSLASEVEQILSNPDDPVN